MDGKQLFPPEKGDLMTRLAVCAVIGIGVVYAAEQLCTGKNIPLWEKYGPWVLENKIQAVAIVAAVLYGVSLALWPEKGQTPPAAEDTGFTPCP